MKDVSFEISSHENSIVCRIVARAVDLAREMGVETPDRGALEMDLVATHANGCPMDFDRLLAASDANFAHDVWGIQRHLDRRTGELGGFFWPRHAKRVLAPVASA